mgnify:CR=1 FL=1
MIHCNQWHRVDALLQTLGVGDEQVVTHQLHLAAEAFGQQLPAIPVDKPEGGTRLVGDVDYDSWSAVAGAITPVPGGVGPMTIACLLANTLTAACRANNVEEPVGLTA